MDAVDVMGEVIKETAERRPTNAAFGCAKLVVFANAVPDNPFMAGAFHGFGEGDAAISVGVSGPGVVASALRRLPAGRADAGPGRGDQDHRLQDHPRRRARRSRGLAPPGRGLRHRRPLAGPDPDARRLGGRDPRALGVERVGRPARRSRWPCSTTRSRRAAHGHLARRRAVGAFIPVSEDANFASAAADGHLVLEKLEAMTASARWGWT